MALTIDASRNLVAGVEYLYRYRTTVVRADPISSVKGVITGGVWASGDGRHDFEFYAANDESAYAYLLANFMPDDTRHLGSPHLLSACRSDPINRLMIERF